MKKLFIGFALALFAAAAVFGQSKTVKAFEENAKGYNFFAYQSVLRVLNQDKNPDFNKLISDLDHLRIVTTDSTGALAMTTFNRLDNGIQKEGFEQIMTFDNKDYKCHIYELSKNSNKTTWVATVFMQGRAGIFEMVGSLDVRYLTAFSSMNMDRVKSMIPEMEGMDWD